MPVLNVEKNASLKSVSCSSRIRMPMPVSGKSYIVGLSGSRAAVYRKITASSPLNIYTHSETAVKFLGYTHYIFRISLSPYGNTSSKMGGTISHYYCNR